MHYGAYSGPCCASCPSIPKGAALDRPGVIVDRLRINHYPIKSRQEFLLKARLKKERRRYEDVDYFAFHDRNEVEDPVLVGWSDRQQQS